MPYRLSANDDDVMILLITSRDTGRWVLPKGNVMVGVSRHRAAAREAEEEAGVLGRISRKPLGRFRYRKWRDARRFEMAKVDVFALQVREELDHWKEQGRRERRWVTRAEAAQMIEESGLRALILGSRLV